MPRRARLTLPGVAQHVIQRGNNRIACFYADDDYQTYLDWMAEYAKDTGCHVHAYVLMTNHAHLLVTPDNKESLGQLMRRLGQRYVQYINRTYRRSGTLWEGRYKSCLCAESDYVLACYRYIELNPVRANMVNHPGDYRWSSYRINAQGGSSSFIEPHETYEQIASDPEDRRLAYRELFRYDLDPGLVDQICQATNGNYALGSDVFKRQVEQALGRRASRGRSGRPRKPKD